jgi:hypothetical protein
MHGIELLSESYPAMGEVAFAIRTIQGLRHELENHDAGEPRKPAPRLHQFFRRGGRLTDSVESAGETFGGRSDLASEKAQESWYDDHLSARGEAGMAKSVRVGQSFRASDGGIKVVVLRVGSASERARFAITNLNAGTAATYTITVHRKSGADPDRIKYETDNLNNPPEYELSADETTGVEIRRERR